MSGLSPLSLAHRIVGAETRVRLANYHEDTIRLAQALVVAETEREEYARLLSSCTCADPACPAHGDSPETAVMDWDEDVL